MNGVRCVVFVDLDDTLFSTARKQPDSAGLMPAALLRSGDVVSYTNPAQRGLHQMLACADEVIPVTARNVDGYRRVLLRFAGRAVLSYGATILDAEGQADAEWARRVAPCLEHARGELEALAGLMSTTAERDAVTVRLVSDGPDPAYLVIRHAGPPESLATLGWFARLTEWLAQHAGFRLHVNGSILAIIPPGLGKEMAVAHLIERERADAGPSSTSLFTVGAGDSLTDLDFMRLCDVAIVPGRSQLAQALLAAATLGREHHQRHPSSASARPGN